jgi:hypothetical protein
MTMGRTVALAAALVFVSAGSVSADDLSEVADDIPESADEAPEVADEAPESAPEVAPKSALPPPDYSRDGIYVGLGGSYGIDTFGNSPGGDISPHLANLGFGGTDPNFDMDGSIGVNGQIGYRFHPHFSAELQIEWLDGFDGDVSESTIAPGSFADFSVDPWSITGNLKAYLLTGRYQPYLSVGAGILTLRAKLKDKTEQGLSSSERITDATGRFGGGVDIYVTENFVATVGASYLLPNGDVSDYDYVSITWGLAYRF